MRLHPAHDGSRTMTCAETVWHRPRGNYELPPDEVHVWRAYHDLPEGCIAALMATLSAQERAQAAKFHFDADRKRSIVGRARLRMLLGHCLRKPADRLQFKYNEFGKPALDGRFYPALEFNVSHSGEVILIALAHGRAVGVDVEKMRMDMAREEIAARFFSPSECRTLAALAPELRCAAFFACWARKEAYLKARGDGLSLPLDGFDVAFGPGEEPRLIATRHDPPEGHRWALRSLEPGRGYKGALAVEGWNWKLKCWDWPAVGAISDFMRSVPWTS